MRVRWIYRSNIGLALITNKDANAKRVAEYILLIINGQPVLRCSMYRL